jgi:hypothetical protein
VDEDIGKRLPWEFGKGRAVSIVIVPFVAVSVSAIHTGTLSICLSFTHVFQPILSRLLQSQCLLYSYPTTVYQIAERLGSERRGLLRNEGCQILEKVCRNLWPRYFQT